MLLPFVFIKFWYIDAINFFLLSWKHSLMFLEEDLAIGLMLKLLFVPLFHDSSIFGRILSILFRLSRVMIGLSAYIVTTFAFLVGALLWFGAPLFLVVFYLIIKVEILAFFFGLIILLGISIFIHQLLHKPLLRLWHVKEVKDLWKATKISQKNLTWEYLLSTYELKNFLALLELTPNQFVAPQHIPITDEYLKRVLTLAKNSDAAFLTESYFWVSFLEEVPGISQALLKLNLKLSDFEEALKFFELKRNRWRKIFIWDEAFSVHHLKGVNRGWLGAPTPALDGVSTDLTSQASSEGFPQFIGREGIVQDVVKILSQTSDRNVLLVGPAGAGKTTLVHTLATRIITGDAPEALATKRLVQLDLPKLLSDVDTQGDLAEKIKNSFEEVKFIEDIIIFVDEIENMGLGQAGSELNLYSLMLPYLESNQFQFIATTDQGNYAKIIEKNGSFARIFHKVEIPPATVPETILALEQEAINLQRYQKLHLSYLAIKDLAELSHKLIHDRVLPDSALSVLKEAEVIAEKGQITSDLIKKALEKRVNVPIVEFDASQKEVLLNMEEVIHQEMIDQEEAVEAVANTLRRSATALREENRPIGSFLFVGPTGVGKTELAKILAKVYFKSSGAFVRFDMSEYQTQEAVGRLIGTDQNPGELTEIIKNRPYCLLLLDEFEKANPQLLNLFLQVLEEGRLTDYSGTHVDFTNTIIIATSNAASLTIAESLGAGEIVGQVEPQVRQELLRVFKPELINRFDQIVIFKPLSSQDLSLIVALKLKELAKRLEAQGYLIEFTPKLIVGLVQKGYDPVLGARPLRRLIQDKLEAKLSKLILEGKLIKGELFTAEDTLLT